MLKKVLGRELTTKPFDSTKFQQSRPGTCGVGCKGSGCSGSCG